MHTIFLILMLSRHPSFLLVETFILQKLDG